jgi:hypothetical protein
VGDENEGGYSVIVVVIRRRLTFSIFDIVSLFNYDLTAQIWARTPLE